MSKPARDIYSDITPCEGRAALAGFQDEAPPKQLTWTGDCSVGGEILWGQSGERSIRLGGDIEDSGPSKPAAGWAEFELSGLAPVIEDLFLVATRPLPQNNITCICRHPFNRCYLAAATSDAHLLLLDAKPDANLKILASSKLDVSFSSLVCCGGRLLGLESTTGRCLHLIDVPTPGEKQPVFIQAGQIQLARTLTALAENDSASVWGLSAKGVVYLLKVPELLINRQHSLNESDGQVPSGRMHRRTLLTFRLTDQVRGIYRSIKAKKLPRLKPGIGPGRFAGLAFDGKNFWTFRRAGKLLLYNRELSLLRSFASRPEVSVFSISYTHNYLLILDKEHQLLHIYYPADTLEPVVALAPKRGSHPGYLGAGTSASGRIHDLCLLYTGGEGSCRVHRYDVDKLLPLAAYKSAEGEIQDYFMDGFLLLAQYSPLLNGRCFAVDLSGPPSRREDWRALFDEYFHPRANLPALEDCAREIEQRLGKRQPLRVVLGVPTPDSRCRDWDNAGYSLAVESHRVEATHWAVDELLGRWKKAHFRRLVLAGFYYLTEQGAFNDPVLSVFPQLCRERGLCSFAIPGLSSSYMTEFNRAGFDCVALQSSHSFWKPAGRPERYLLKCAGHIARDFGMGMEVELPYNVLEKEGAGKLKDYLEMARIQGWAGAFKAYFQSYNLIKSLADSQIPECRRLYDKLYYMSRLSRQPQTDYHTYHQSIPVDWQGTWVGNSEKDYFRINIEGNQGIFRLTELSIE